MTSRPPIHFRSDTNSEFVPGGDITNVRLFTSVDAFILPIAGVNFANLAKAQASKRANNPSLISRPAGC